MNLVLSESNKAQELPRPGCGSPRRIPCGNPPAIAQRAQACALSPEHDEQFATVVAFAYFNRPEQPGKALPCFVWPLLNGRCRRCHWGRCSGRFTSQRVDVAPTTVAVDPELLRRRGQRVTLRAHTFDLSLLLGCNACRHGAVLCDRWTAQGSGYRACARPAPLFGRADAADTTNLHHDAAGQ
jgi:hypothetical protein